MTSDNHSKQRIFYIENPERAAPIVAIRLQKAGYHIIIHSGSDQTYLHQILETQPDCILIDSYTHLDENQILPTLREHPTLSRIPILRSVPHNGSVERHSAYKYDLLINVPIRVPALLATLEYLLNTPYS